MNLNNNVVKAYTYTQAKQIVQWFKSNGVDSSFFMTKVGFLMHLMTTFTNTME